MDLDVTVQVQEPVIPSQYAKLGGYSLWAEVVIALYGPNRDKLNTYRGYDVKKLGDHIRMVQILKTRFGEADKEIAVNFHGGVNIWTELPLPTDIYDYDKYVTPDYLLGEDEEKTKQEDNGSNFKLIL